MRVLKKAKRSDNNMKVPFINLKIMHEEIENELVASFKSVLDKSSFILGSELSDFEKNFSVAIGAKHSIGVGSGTDAIFLALKALGIGKGDEVITVSMTFVSTAIAIKMTGATPVFVDIDKDTMCIDVSKIEEKINTKTKAIVPVHLYGRCCDMDKINSLAKKNNLFTVEDACQAFGSEYKGEKAGNLSDLAAFSFYPTKNIGALGDGGMVVSRNSEVAEKIKFLRNYGEEKKYFYKYDGYNSRLDEVQAAVLNVKLKKISKWNNAKTMIYEKYNNLLTDKIIKPIDGRDCLTMFHLYVVRTDKRDDLLNHLNNNNIQAMVHYPLPVHRQKPFLDNNIRDDLSVTEKSCQEVISLPYYYGMTDVEIEFVVKTVNKFFGD